MMEGACVPSLTWLPLTTGTRTAQSHLQFYHTYHSSEKTSKLDVLLFHLMALKSWFLGHTGILILHWTVARLLVIAMLLVLSLRHQHQYHGKLREGRRESVNND